MKKIVPFILIICLALSVCAKANDISSEPLTLYPAYLQTPLNQPVVLEAETYPEGQKLIWESSDISVTTVDAEGCVTPVAVGEAVVTCSLADQPSVTATCGVRVALDGNILFWEYPLKPMDLDAIIAEMEANDEDNNGDSESAWPDFWPGELPKLDGTVVTTFGSLEEPDGMGVSVKVQGKDEIKAYVGMLVSSGFIMGSEIDNDGYLAELSGKGFIVTVIYMDDNKLCMLRVNK